MREKRILLVDDDEAQVNTFRSVLEREGYRVETALTSREALRKAGDIRFDLAILDIALPDIRGDEISGELRRRDQDINIILITGYPSLQDCIDTLDLGIHEILLKPIAPSELLLSIKEALGGASGNPHMETRIK